MTEENHTIRLLNEMRNEVREGFKSVDRELAQAKAERRDLKRQMTELRAHVGESETRLATELLAVSGAIQEAKGLIMQ